MTTIDLSPLYRSSVGFDSLASILDSVFTADQSSGGYPPYNIEIVEENRYKITLAVSGFTQSELEIQVENGVLTIRGRKDEEDKKRNFLHKGIATRAFERKFNLADYVEVQGADLSDGLLNINLRKEIPEVMKPKNITISSDAKAIDANHKLTEVA